MQRLWVGKKVRIKWYYVIRNKVVCKICRGKIISKNEYRNFWNVLAQGMGLDMIHNSRIYKY